MSVTGTGARLILGDSAQVLRDLEPESIDALVTDPPWRYGDQCRHRGGAA